MAWPNSQQCHRPLPHGNSLGQPQCAGGGLAARSATHCFSCGRRGVQLDTFTTGRYSSKGLSLLDGLPGGGGTFIGGPHTETVRRTQLPGAGGKAHCLLPKHEAPTLPWHCTMLTVLACGWTVAAAVHDVLAGGTIEPAWRLQPGWWALTSTVMADVTNASCCCYCLVLLHNVYHTFGVRTINSIIN